MAENGSRNRAGRHAGDSPEADSFDEWLPPDLEGTEGEAAPSRSAKMWSAPTPAPEVEVAPSPPSDTEVAPSPPHPDPDLEAELEGVRDSLRLAQARAREAEDRALSAEERAEAAERELAQTRKRVMDLKRAAARAAAAQHPASAPQTSPPEPAETPGREVPRGGLNALSFEALRAMGLSLNQAARVVGFRDQLGGFRSIDDVDAVPGLPRELKQRLKEVGAT
jgi:DNA uptake protein ComE-like DNA-binding protein